MLPVWKTWLKRALPHLRGPRVLEVSFGTGYLMMQYAGRFETCGVDLNAAMVATARRNLERNGLGAELVQGDVQALPYPDGSFDTVLSTMSFSGYPDGHAALSEMTRVLKPDGRLVLIDVGYPRDGNWMGMRLAAMWRRLGDLLRDMDVLLAGHGLEADDQEVGGFGSVHLYVCEKRRPAATK